MSLFKKTFSNLFKTRKKISDTFKKVFRKGSLSDEDCYLIEETLLSADVSWELTDKIISNIKNNYNTEKDWEDFGWQGLRLRVPSDWNLGRVDGDAEKGYARIDDAEIVRAEIEWRKLKGREVGVPLSDLVDRYLEGLKKKADKAGAGFEIQRRARFLREKQWLDGYDYEVFTWDADFRAFNIALRFVSTQRVVLLRVLAQRDEDQIDVVERIFRSLREEADR